MPMRGLRGDKWTEEQVVGFSKTKIRDLDKLIESLLPWQVLPEDFKPKALIFEAEAAKRAFGQLIKGNTSKALDWFRCLPNAIGKVGLYNNEFVVHLGIANTHEIRPNKKGVDVVVNVGLIRDVGSMDPWAWVYAFDASDEERRGLVSGSHELKAENTGIVTCIGWNEMRVEFEDDTDPRTYKSIKIGEKHPCGVTFPANEPWHRVRCKECHDTLGDWRDRAWSQFKAPSKKKKGLSKAKTEKTLLDLLSLLD